jgi:hypothetical protein
MIQSERALAPGIITVETAGHGGIKLDRTRNAKVPEYMRRHGGWYEEDCEWSIAAVVFPDEFAKANNCAHGNIAKSTLLDWYPDEYIRFFGVSLESVENHSYVLRKRKFQRAHADDYVVVSATGSWHEKVPEGFVGVSATKGGIRTEEAYRSERYFLIPEHEYEIRTDGFVIDITRHEEWVDHE